MIMPNEPDDQLPKALPEGESSQEAPDAEELNEKIAKALKGRIDESKRCNKDYHNEWKGNVDRRLGHVASIYTGGISTDNEVQAEINPDWALTKTKTANLYSQVPQVGMTHENKQYAPAVPIFAKAINYELGEKRVNIGVPMEETLNDVVNASGVGAVLVGYAARFETKEVPAMETLPGPQGPIKVSDLPPEQLDKIIAAAKQANIPFPMKPVEVPTDQKFFAMRISPMDLLWPENFVGSNFDDGDFIGYRGRTNWPDAKNEFKLDDEDKEKAVGSGEHVSSDSLRSEGDAARSAETEEVEFECLYYWRHRVDPEEKSFQCIWRLVYVKGITKPVIHEAWKGQKLDPQTRKYVGNVRFPIRVLTLTYISDNPIPPSDSAAGRPQVNDMRRSRSQMFQNRERSTPIRWFDVNRIDPALQDNLMKGIYQGMIPTNGDGSRSIGEIARASYPSEDISFDQAAKTDLMETWQIGPNQMGTTTPGKKSGTEANIVQQAFATRIGQERARVAAFFLGCVEVLAGWMVLYSDFPNLTDQERQTMQSAWDQKHILHDLVLKIRPDSTIVLDSQQRVQRLSQFLNMTVKSGFVNPKTIITEMAELSGLDPTEVVVDPQPKPPEEPNMSYRFSGKDDLMSIPVVAMLIHHKKWPTPEEIQQAKQSLESLLQPSPPPGAAPLSGAPPAAGPGGPPSPPPGGGPPVAQVPHPTEAAKHEDWQLASKVAKRSRDMGPGA
jgi:hypothetical protein